MGYKCDNIYMIEVVANWNADQLIFLMQVLVFSDGKA